MAKSKEQAALALAPQDEAAALAVFDDFNFENDGLEEIDAEDIRFAVKVWNMRSKKPEGGLFQVDEFFDTLTEKTARELRCVFVSLHKTNDYAYFDNSTQETVRVCSSYNRIEGTLRTTHPTLGLAEGTVRKCETCPDSEWRKERDKDGRERNVRPCAPVYGVIGIELDDEGNPTSPFMIRFKKTSLQPFKSYLQKHHIKKRQDPKTRKMVDVPLFGYAVRITLEADKGGQYAVPIIERGDVMPRELLISLSEQVKHFREMADDVTRAAEKKETQHGAEGVVETQGEPLRSDDFAG
jgi:hypothetical protein